MKNNRLTDGLMESFKIKSDKEVEAKSVGVVRYDEAGNDDTSRNKKISDIAACIKVVKKKNPEYLAKQNRRGELFNPVQKSSNYHLAAKEKTTGENSFQFRPVNQLAYENYLNYLKSRQETYLTLANRELYNGF